MTDNELNEMVAERVMGLRNVRSMYGQTVYDMVHTYAMDIESGEETITYQPAPIPDYANDIAAAWQVWGRVKTSGHWGEFLDAITPDGYYSGMYDLSPRAICLAALEAVGAEVE